MGWYVTCTICRRTDKHGLYCDCYAKEVKRLIEGKKGCLIVDCFEDCFGLYECLKRENGEIYYLFTSMFNGCEDSVYSQKIVEVDKESYEKAKYDHENPHQEDEENDDDDEERKEDEEETDQVKEPEKSEVIIPTST